MTMSVNAPCQHAHSGELRRCHISWLEAYGNLRNQAVRWCRRCELVQSAPFGALQYIVLERLVLETCARIPA